MKQWEKDKKWADSYWPEIEKIIRSVAGQVIEVSQATEQEDREHAIDYVVRVTSGDIACRVRQAKYLERFGDITIRSRRASGVKTELDKLREGYCRWYLYVWISEHKPFWWLLLDLDVMRQKGVFDLASMREIWNHDGESAFITIPIFLLEEIGAIKAQSNGQIHSRLQKIK